ncbi:unnamed protein product, partial [marine sediment metagenome]
MHNPNFKKNKRILILFLITTTMSFLTFSPLVWDFYDSQSNLNSPTGFESFNELKISDYSSNFGSAGENMNITLHQSYLNNSINTIVNTSDSSNNKITLPSPTDTTFNSTYTNLTINDLYAPNKTLIVEDDTITSFDDFTNANPLVTSFSTAGDGYLENISVYVRNIAGNPATVTVVLYNSTWDTGNSRNEPDGNNLGYVATLGTFGIPATTTGTYSVKDVHYLLDNTNTENNTWFIGLFDG